MKFLVRILLSTAIAACMAACIEDDFTTSPSDQPRFSVEEIDMGQVFTDQTTPTSRFTIHNPHSKSLLLEEVSVSGADASCFHINVDGSATAEFQRNIEIRGKDSVFVLVQATLPERGDLGSEFTASIDVRVNGVVSSLPIKAQGVNAERIKGETFTADTRLTARKPYIITDSLTVAEGATLTIEAGTTLCFHDKAMLIVRGTLLSEGTAEAPVTMAGDRTGNVVSDISFDIMSRQWTGVFFTESSAANRLVHTNIRNTVQGVAVSGNPEADYSSTPQLTLLNSVLRNSGELVLEGYHTSIDATGCEFAEAGAGLVYLQGGSHRFDHCTFANNYLFTAIGGPAVQFAHLSADPKTGLDDESGLPYLKGSFTNSIIYGIGSEVSHGDLTGTDVYFRRCLLKSAGTDDDNFLECIWGEDPLFYTERLEYIFDYRLRPESPAIGAADPSLSRPEAATDIYGLARGAAPDLGAYVFTLPAEE